MDDSNDLDLRSFYKQTFALLPTVSKRNLKGIKIDDPPHLTKNRKVRTDAPPISTTDKFAMNCRNAFNRFCRPYTATGGRQDHGIPFECLELAIGLVHSNITSDQIKNMAETLLWSTKELISFEEFQRFCWQLFQESLQKKDKSIVPHDIASPGGSPLKPHVDSFKKMSRKQHYVSTASIGPTGSNQLFPATASTFSKSSSVGGLSAIEKDAVCEVVKKENREKRNNNAYSCYGDAIPRHQAPLEKTAVLGVCNPSERLHVKWRETLQRRKDRDSRLRARRDGRALNQIIAASVQACDRMAVNSILKHQDIAHYESLVRNWEQRRAEEEASHDNVDRWRQEVYAARLENIRALKTSKRLAQQLVDDSKMKAASDASVSSGSSFAGSSGYFWEDDEKDSTKRYAVSVNSSSLVAVPADIEDRIKNARREKDYLAAKQEKKEFIEQTLMNRLKNYGAAKGRSKMLAGLNAEVSISSIDGADYFVPRTQSKKQPRMSR